MSIEEPPGDPARCDRCRWYEEPVAGFRYGTCHLADSANGRPTETTGSGWPPMFALDPEEQAAELKVLPTFGCSAFQRITRKRRTGAGQACPPL